MFECFSSADAACWGKWRGNPHSCYAMCIMCHEGGNQMLHLLWVENLFCVCTSTVVFCQVLPDRIPCFKLVVSLGGNSPLIQWTNWWRRAWTSWLAPIILAEIQSKPNSSWEICSDQHWWSIETWKTLVVHSVHIWVPIVRGCLWVIFGPKSGAVCSMAFFLYILSYKYCQNSCIISSVIHIGGHICVWGGKDCKDQDMVSGALIILPALTASIKPHFAEMGVYCFTNQPYQPNFPGGLWDAKWP